MCDQMQFLRHPFGVFDGYAPGDGEARSTGPCEAVPVQDAAIWKMTRLVGLYCECGDGEPRKAGFKDRKRAGARGINPFDSYLIP